jgi:hypothetical protein
MSREEAEKQPGGLALVQAIGAQETVEPDIGFYVGTEDPHLAAERGRQGLPLRRGDSLLVCSDGLVKPSAADGPAVRKEEIVSVLGASNGDEAARTLIAFALGRLPDDNVSVALIQLADPGRPARIRARRRLSLVTAGVAVGVLLIGFVYLLRERDRLEQANRALAAAATQAQAPLERLPESELRRGEVETQVWVAVMETMTASAAAATPSSTQSPAAREGAYTLGAGGSAPLPENGLVETGGEGALVFVPAPDGAGSALLVVGPSTQLSLQASTSRKVLVSLGAGGMTLVWSGGFPDGVVLSFGPTGSSLNVRAGCAMLGPSTETAADGWDVTCWGGECTYSGAIGTAAIPLRPWERLALSWDPLQTAVFPVGEAELETLQTVLASAPEGLEPEAIACLTP